VQLVSSDASSSSSNSIQGSGVKVLNGSEKDTKVKLELSTIPQKVVAGQLVTLILDVK
jgi:hypothetical protein